MDAALGLVGGLIMALSAAYYLLDVVRRRTRPQRSSWAVWAVTGAVGFGTAEAGGAGPGAYAAAVDAIACLVTFAISLLPRYGKPGGRRTDPALVALALTGVVLWRWGPLPEGGAAALVVGCECVALWPTLREAWHQPELECLASWAADLVGSTLCVFAIAHVSLAAVVYPLYLVAASAAVVAILLARRRSAYGKDGTNSRRRSRSTFSSSGMT